MTYRWPLPSAHIGVSTPVVGSCCLCLGCSAVGLATLQAVTVIKYFECRPWHLLKFSYGVLDKQFVIKINLQTGGRIQPLRCFARTILFKCVEVRISKLIRKNRRECGPFLQLFSVLRSAYYHPTKAVFQDHSLGKEVDFYSPGTSVSEDPIFLSKMLRKTVFGKKKFWKMVKR